MDWCHPVSSLTQQTVEAVLRELKWKGNWKKKQQKKTWASGYGVSTREMGSSVKVKYVEHPDLWENYFHCCSY